MSAVFCLMGMSHGWAQAINTRGQGRYPDPATRPLILQENMLPTRRVTTDANGISLHDAQAHSGNQMRIMGLVPLLLHKRVNVLAGGNYLREQGTYTQAGNTLGRDTSLTYTRQDISLSVTASYQDSLFRQPVLYLATVTAASRRFGDIEKVTGGVTALLTLRSTPTTRMAAGVTLQYNPSITVPAVPLFSYWHHFQKSPWEIDILLPQRAHLRRPLLHNTCWLSVGTDLMSTHSFGSGTVPGFSATFEANTTSLQTGVTFEYLATQYFMLGMRGGLDSPLSQWVGDVNSSQALVKAKAGSAGYVGLVLSVVVPTKKR